LVDAHVVIADEHRLALADGRRLLEALDLVPAVAPCARFEFPTDGHSVVLVVPLPETGDRARATQEALRMLAGALFARRRSMRERRDRVRRVTTLNPMLEDIASNLDVDQVLAAIVERARDLLSSDCAYLSEVDEATRRVTMRATSGIRDAGYK